MDTKVIIVRVYSNTDKEVLERTLKSMGIGPERYSFDSYHENYCFNEISLKITDEEFKLLKFRLQMRMPEVYEFG